MIWYSSDSTWGKNIRIRKSIGKIAVLFRFTCLCTFRRWIFYEGSVLEKKTNDFYIKYLCGNTNTHTNQPTNPNYIVLTHSSNILYTIFIIHNPCANNIILNLHIFYMISREEKTIFLGCYISDVHCLHITNNIFFSLLFLRQ